MSNELVPGLLGNIIKRFDLEFEIVHPKAQSLPFEANEIINGVYISYYLVSKTKENLDQLFPRRQIKRFTDIMKEIFNNAGVRIGEILLHLDEEHIFSSGYEARVCIDKTRTMALMELESIPLRNQQGWRSLLWHEVLHLEDIYKRRFPSMHPVVSDIYPWLCFLWHFSIEGRLEKMGIPARTKEETVKELTQFIEISDEDATNICEDFWGKLVTFEELFSVGKDFKEREFRARA